jgi:hypothetical protein
LGKIAGGPLIKPESLAMLLPEKTIDKFDRYLDPELQALNFAAARLDTARLQEIAGILLRDLEKC